MTKHTRFSKSAEQLPRRLCCVKDSVTSSINTATLHSLPNRLTAVRCSYPLPRARTWNVRRLRWAHISVCRSRHQKYDIYIRTFASSRLCIHTNVQAPDLTLDLCPFCSTIINWRSNSKIGRIRVYAHRKTNPINHEDLRFSFGSLVRLDPGICACQACCSNHTS